MIYEHRPSYQSHPHHIDVEFDMDDTTNEVPHLWDALRALLKDHMDLHRDAGGCAESVLLICGTAVIAQRYGEFFRSLGGSLPVMVREGSVGERSSSVIHGGWTKTRTPLNYRIAFKHKADAMLFKLTFGGE